MSDKIDLKRLAKMASHDRAFLSIYLSGPDSLKRIKKRIDNIKKMLKENKDESEHFEKNLKLIEDYFHKHPYKSGSLCVFCCWLLDYLEAYPLSVQVQDMVWVDSSPYIRPLAELEDEYEDFAVVVADNKLARIFLVASGKTDSEEKIKGNIKNHVKVGGWSQQRYERRRDKELHKYAKEIVDNLKELDKKEEFRRIILVGGKEAIREIHKAMPDRLAQNVVAEKALDLGKPGDYLGKEIFDLFFVEERKSERDLWEQIKTRYMRGEPAVVGMQDVLYAARMGRVEKAIVNRAARFSGVRCGDCEGLFHGELDECSDCGSESVFAVDLTNEMVELLSKTGAEIDFAEEIEELTEVGGIAALLRY